MQTPLTAGNARQKALLLRFTGVAQQRTHDVDLAVAGARIAATAVDLFHDHAGLDQARAAVLLRDQRSQPTRAGQRIDEGCGVAAFSVDLAVIGIREFGAERAHGVANI